MQMTDSDVTLNDWRRRRRRRRSSLLHCPVQGKTATVPAHSSTHIHTKPSAGRVHCTILPMLQTPVDFYYLTVAGSMPTAWPCIVR